MSCLSTAVLLDEAEELERLVKAATFKLRWFEGRGGAFDLRSWERRIVDDATAKTTSDARSLRDATEGIYATS